MILSTSSWSHKRRQFGIPRLLLLSSSLFSVASVSPRLVNVTVDDTLGDPDTGSIPDYSPNSAAAQWHDGSSTEDCNCNIGPSILDLTQIYKQTWHDTTNYSSTEPVTITVHFTGSAVYVFNILPNTLPYTATAAHIVFSIDGEDVGLFTHSPDAGTTILYNQLVYNSTALQHGPHALTMTVGNGSLVLFDYFIYTTTESNDTTSASAAATRAAQSSSSRTPTGAIIGGVIGGVVVLGVAVGAFLLHRRRTRCGNNRDGNGSGASSGSLWQPGTSPTSTTLLPPDPLMQLRGGPTAHSHSGILYLASGGVSGPDTRLTPFVADAPSPSTTGAQVEWSPKRRAELTQRLATLQQTRSALSSQAPSRQPRSEVSSESGTETAIRELEAEMAQLRGVLSTLNARLADGHGGHLESLPEYVA